MKNIARQFSIARKERLQKEAEAPGGSIAAAGKIEMPGDIKDGVIWEDPQSRKSFVRISGNRIIMVFKVGLQFNHIVRTLCHKFNKIYSGTNFPCIF